MAIMLRFVLANVVAFATITGVASAATPSVAVPTEEKFQKAMGGLSQAMQRLSSFSLPQQSKKKSKKESVMKVDTSLYPEALADYISDQDIEDEVNNLQRKQKKNEWDKIKTVGTGPVALSGQEVLFPDYGDTNEEYEKLKQRFTRRFVEARSAKDRNEGRLRLIKLNVAFKRYVEALNMLEYMPRNKRTKMPKNPYVRAINGAILVLTGEAEKAIPYLEEGKTLEAQRMLWLAAAYEQLDNDTEALVLFRSAIKHSQPYPIHIQRVLHLAYARILLRQEQITQLMAELKLLSQVMPTGELPAEGLLMLARANFLLKNDGLGENLLAQAAAADDPEVAFMAQYEFVSFLLKKGDIGVEQAIKHLEKLRFLWRGGQMEETILYKLGRMYLARGDQRNGLERLKYYTIYFAGGEHATEATDTMISSFKGLFKGEDISKLDPLGIAGIYYDYRELTPPGKDGDYLVNVVAEKLRLLGLFDRAITLLERQLRYRTKGTEEKAKIGYNLADLYGLNLQFKEGLNTLNRTEAPNLPEGIVHKRTLLQATLLIKTKQSNEALKVLKYVKGEKARHMRIDIAWLQKDYAKIIKEIEPDFVTEFPRNIWTEREENNFLKLAMAYNVKNRTQDLERLKELYAHILETKESVAVTIDFLLKERLSTEVEPLGKQEKTDWNEVILGLEGYATFRERYENFRLKREEERKEKEMFNRRMRQANPPKVHQSSLFE